MSSFYYDPDETEYIYREQILRPAVDKYFRLAGNTCLVAAPILFVSMYVVAIFGSVESKLFTFFMYASANALVFGLCLRLSVGLMKLLYGETRIVFWVAENCFRIAVYPGYRLPGEFYFSNMKRISLFNGEKNGVQRSLGIKWHHKLNFMRKERLHHVCIYMTDGNQLLFSVSNPQKIKALLEEKTGKQVNESVV